MTKKKVKEVVRAELEEKADVSLPKNTVSFTFGREGKGPYFSGHRASISSYDGRVDGITFHGPGAHSFYVVSVDEDIDDLLGVMRRMVAIADALEVLNDQADS